MRDTKFSLNYQGIRRKREKEIEEEGTTGRERSRERLGVFVEHLRPNLKSKKETTRRMTEQAWFSRPNPFPHRKGKTASLLRDWKTT